MASTCTVWIGTDLLSSTVTLGLVHHVQSNISTVEEVAGAVRQVARDPVQNKWALEWTGEVHARHGDGARQLQRYGSLELFGLGV